MEKLIKVATELNETHILERLERAQHMKESAKLRVAVMGPFNGGKTTLINGILGQEVREPSLLPHDGKPLRISFERCGEDARYDCAYVVHKELCIADVLLFEYASEVVFAHDRTEDWTDEIDFAFYLMPATHFLTSTDRDALRALSEAAIPVQPVVTMLDQIRQDEREMVTERETAMCRDAGLSEPILADGENWAEVYRQMFDKLPLTVELNQQREAHAQAIVQACRHCLEDAVARRSNQERAVIDPAVQAQKRIEEASEALKANRAKLLEDCRRTREQSLRLAQEFVPAVDRFMQEQIAKGHASGFSKEFLDKLTKDLKTFCGDQLKRVCRKVSADVDWLIKSALSHELISADVEQELDGRSKQLESSAYLGDQSMEILFLQFCADRQPDGVLYPNSKQGKVVSPRLIGTAAVVGATSIAALISPMSAPLTGGTIAAAVGLGGYYYYQQNSSEQRKANEEALTRRGHEFAAFVHDFQEGNIRGMFDEISEQLKNAKSEPVPPADIEAHVKELERIERLADELKADD